MDQSDTLPFDATQLQVELQEKKTPPARSPLPTPEEVQALCRLPTLVLGEEEPSPRVPSPKVSDGAVAEPASEELHLPKVPSPKARAAAVAGLPSDVNTVEADKSCLASPTLQALAGSPQETGPRAFSRFRFNHVEWSRDFASKLCAVCSFFHLTFPHSLYSPRDRRWRASVARTNKS